jgi:hypothetical protein
MILTIKTENFTYFEIDNLSVFKDYTFSFTILIQYNRLYHSETNIKFYRNINFIINKIAKYSRFINSQIL